MVHFEFYGMKDKSIPLDRQVHFFFFDDPFLKVDIGPGKIPEKSDFLSYFSVYWSETSEMMMMTNDRKVLNQFWLIFVIGKWQIYSAKADVICHALKLNFFSLYS